MAVLAGFHQLDEHVVRTLDVGQLGSSEGGHGETDPHVLLFKSLQLLGKVRHVESEVFEAQMEFGAAPFEGLARRL